MTGALTLSGDPNAELHAATKRYVDTKLETKQVVYTTFKTGVSSGGSHGGDSGSQKTMLDTPLTISTTGGYVKFEANAVAVAGMLSDQWNGVSSPDYARWFAYTNFLLYRDGVFLMSVIHTTKEQRWYERAGTQHLFSPTLEIPDFYDPNPGGTPSSPVSHTYDLQWSTSSLDTTGINISNSNHYLMGAGQWFAIET